MTGPSSQNAMFLGEKLEKSKFTYNWNKITQTFTDSYVLKIKYRQQSQGSPINNVSQKMMQQFCNKLLLQNALYLFCYKH